MAPRYHTCVIPRHAASTYLGTNRVDPATGTSTDVAVEGRAAFPLAAHAAQVESNEPPGDRRQLRIALEAEARPGVAIGATGAAGLASLAPFLGSEVSPSLVLERAHS